jgi:GNAT superfamily N-acetyltransferase
MATVTTHPNCRDARNASLLLAGASLTAILFGLGTLQQRSDDELEGRAPTTGVTITTLAERPELARGVWQTACEAFPEIPQDEPMQAGSYEQFTAAQLAGPRYIPEATFLALDGEQVVGYSKLAWMSRSAGIADHEMIAVRIAWRGRGIPQALKSAQIAWAIDNGLSELRVGNEERNTAARAVNAHFSYTPLPDSLHLRGPCAAATVTAVHGARS